MGRGHIGLSGGVIVGVSNSFFLVTKVGKKVEGLVEPLDRTCKEHGTEGKIGKPYDIRFVDLHVLHAIGGISHAHRKVRSENRKVKERKTEEKEE